jgi:predicted DNA-binding transcriptional regulator AlpA
MLVALKDDGVVRPQGTLTRKQAANFLGMNDTEFALRLIWDSAFPKPVQGTFRQADILAWMRAQRAGAANKSRQQS